MYQFVALKSEFATRVVSLFTGHLGIFLFYYLDLCVFNILSVTNITFLFSYSRSPDREVWHPGQQISLGHGQSRRCYKT